MRIIGQKTLHQFGVDHADCRNWLNNWVAEIKQATWKTPNDIKQRFASVSILSNNIAIFNVRGNDYRLETQIAYHTGIVAIKWIGTHAQYSRRHR